MAIRPPGRWPTEALEPSRKSGSRVDTPGERRYRCSSPHGAARSTRSPRGTGVVRPDVEVTPARTSPSGEVCHEHHVLLENGTEEGSKASADFRAGRFGDRRGCSSQFPHHFDGQQSSILMPVRGTASRPEPGSTLIAAASAAHDLDGEFDPGSGRTLAACLTHASRAGSIQWQHWGRPSGERAVSYTHLTLPTIYSV